MIDLEYCKIDPSKSSPDKTKKEIERLELMANEWKNEEMAIKLMINSIYGALGNKWFVCFNPDIAESVTLQGQDLIKYAEKVINRYFQEFWHKDKELHEQLKITSVRRVTSPMIVYADTDSNYICFDEVINSCDFKGSPQELILGINKLRLEKYLMMCFEKYSKKWNTENNQDFELESISESGIWLGKKKYVLNLIWKDGIDIESLSDIKPTGVEIIQSSTPSFVRKKLKELLKYIFQEKSDLKLMELITLLKKIKDEFRLQDPIEISQGTAANNIEKFIINDTTDFEIRKGCPIHIRASGYYNYLLNNSKYKNKYELIRSGDKIKYYYVDTKNDRENDIFGFIPGTYPYEFAPPIDYDHQFKKTIIDPLNRFITVMGYPGISSNLFFENPLF